MKNLNSVIVAGNLVKNAEIKNSVCKFTIACTTNKKNGDEWENYANYFDVVIFGKYADAMCKHLEKGAHVAIQGTLHQERWQDKDKNTKSRVVIYADNIELLKYRSNDDDVPFYE